MIFETVKNLIVLKMWVRNRLKQLQWWIGNKGQGLGDVNPNRRENPTITQDSIPSQNSRLKIRMQHLTRLYSSNFKIKVKSFLAKILTIEMTHLKRLTSLRHFKFKWKLLKTSSNTAMTTKKRKRRNWNLMGESYPLQLNKWLSWTK